MQAGAVLVASKGEASNDELLGTSLARWHRDHQPDAAFAFPREVLDDHLALAAAGDWQTDLDRNVDEDIVVLTGFGVFTGREQVRILAELLNAQLPGASFDYTTVLVHGRWRSSSGQRMDHRPRARTRRLIPDPHGRIVVQAIHDTVENLTDDT